MRSERPLQVFSNARIVVLYDEGAHMSDDVTPVLDLSAVLDTSPPSDPTRRVYTNRHLDMSEIKAIGFDMDYTLVQYHQRPMDELAIRKTIDKLIESHGYPEEIREAKIDHDFIIRGLVVDKQTGHICKLDQDRVVGRCYHGYQPVSDEERRALYGTKPISLSSSRFIRVDTLFSLPESTLMAGIIEHYKLKGAPLPKTPGELCIDIRNSIDEAHCDNSLKAEIIADLNKYVIKDPDLAPTLHKLKSAGKKLFLLTNSEHYYTDAVMRFLLDGALPFFESWRDYFDVSIVSGRKPSFFQDPNPFVRLDESGLPLEEPVQSFMPRAIYKGGNLQELERLMRLTGDSILYVGDHVYSDILLSKRSAWWRTALVIQEMEEGISKALEQSAQVSRLQRLDEAARLLDDSINYHLTLTRSLERVQKLIFALTSPETHVIDTTRDKAHREIERKRAQLAQTLAEMEALETEVERTFNKYWGQTFRERHELSLFGDQVETYADIYTSKVSNFLFYSPDQHFRAARNFMPHERENLKGAPPPPSPEER
jgi:5'-nucleotidase